MAMERLFKLMAEKKASDLFIAVGSAVHMKVNGTSIPINQQLMDNGMIKSLLSEIVKPEDFDLLNSTHELNRGFGVTGVGRFRLSAFQQRGSISVVIRYIASDIPPIDTLHLPPIVSDIIMEKRGLVLVVGATGSGKSTTIASMLDLRNTKKTGHILTLEDPIEFVHKPRRSLINQREVGSQTHTFTAALRSALREDPDVILVGELRDLETTALALTAAETGHLVFATVHTSSAPKTVDRLVDIFPAGQQAQIRTMLSESLLGVITQMLLHKVGGGRAAALEILIGTAAVRNLIREAKTHQIPSAMQVGAKVGMQTMEAAVLSLMKRGVVTMDEVRIRMPDTAALLERQAGAQ
jgi:pilus retraction protein PilT